MAMMDYGAIITKNGKILNEDEMFYPMEKTLGFTVDYALDRNKIFELDGKLRVDGNYFVYAGNKDVFFAFYKQGVVVIEKEGENYVLTDYLYEKDYFNGYTYKKDGVEVYICYSGNSRATAFINVGEDHYEILFGFGVDANYKTQLNVAFDYNFSIYDISYITKRFWNRPVRVVNIKRKKRKEYCDLEDKYSFYYEYKRVKEK